MNVFYPWKSFLREIECMLLLYEMIFIFPYTPFIVDGCKQIYELIEQQNQVCTANPF